MSGYSQKLILKYDSEIGKLKKKIIPVRTIIFGLLEFPKKI